MAAGGQDDRKRSDISRVPVATERLNQWRCDTDAVCGFVAGSLGLQRSDTHLPMPACCTSAWRPATSAVRCIASKQGIVGKRERRAIQQRVPVLVVGLAGGKGRHLVTTDVTVCPTGGSSDRALVSLVLRTPSLWAWPPICRTPTLQKMQMGSSSCGGCLVLPGAAHAGAGKAFACAPGQADDTGVGARDRGSSHLRHRSTRAEAAGQKFASADVVSR